MIQAISLVVPTRNRAETLHRCLTAARRQTHSPCEVIVVDDASTDGTDAMIRRSFPHVCYLRQPHPRGPAAARNRGISAASGEIIAFTDDDCLLPTDFLMRLSDGYQRYPDVAGVGGYHEAPPEVLATRVCARYEAYCTRHIYGAGEQEYCGGFECPAGGTSSMSYRRSVLDEVGGFDETFPVAAGEDAALKWSVVRHDYRLLYLPLKVTHLRSYDAQAFWHQQVDRGIGAAHFEWRVYKQYPRPTRIALRCGKRTLRAFPDMVRMGPSLAGVQLIASWADVWGQYGAWRRHGRRLVHSGREH